METSKSLESSTGMVTDSVSILDPTIVVVGPRIQWQEKKRVPMQVGEEDQELNSPNDEIAIKPNEDNSGLQKQHTVLGDNPHSGVPISLSSVISSNTSRIVEEKGLSNYLNELMHKYSLQIPATKTGTTSISSSTSSSGVSSLDNYEVSSQDPATARFRANTKLSLAPDKPKSASPPPPLSVPSKWTLPAMGDTNSSNHPQPTKVGQGSANIVARAPNPDLVPFPLSNTSQYGYFRSSASPAPPANFLPRHPTEKEMPQRNSNDPFSMQEPNALYWKNATEFGTKDPKQNLERLESILMDSSSKSSSPEHTPAPDPAMYWVTQTMNIAPKPARDFFGQLKFPLSELPQYDTAFVPSTPAFPQLSQSTQPKPLQMSASPFPLSSSTNGNGNSWGLPSSSLPSVSSSSLPFIEGNMPSQLFELAEQPYEIQRKCYKKENRCLLPNPLQVLLKKDHLQASNYILDGVVTVSLVGEDGKELPSAKQQSLKSVEGGLTHPLDLTKGTNFSLKISETTDGVGVRLMYVIVYRIRGNKICEEKLLSEPFEVCSNSKRKRKLIQQLEGNRDSATGNNNPTADPKPTTPVPRPQLSS